MITDLMHNGFAAPSITLSHPEKRSLPMKKSILNRTAMLFFAMLAGAMASVGANAAHAAVTAAELAQASQMKYSSIAELANDSRTFKADKAIAVKMVTFSNRYGFDVAGHMYLPARFDLKGKYKAVVITGPFGAV